MPIQSDLDPHLQFLLPHQRTRSPYFDPMMLPESVDNWL